MAKESKEQAPKTPAETLAELEQAASFEKLIASADPHINALVKHYGEVIEAIRAMKRLGEQQELAANVAREFAEKNGLPTSARVLGRNPMIAHCIDRLGKIPAPPVDKPSAWLAQFREVAGEEGAAAIRRANYITTILNDGAICSVQGMTEEQVAASLLMGVDPRNTTPASPALWPSATSSERSRSSSNPKDWYGFRGRHDPTAPIVQEGAGDGNPH